MKVNVSEVQDVVLNYLVAKARGMEFTYEEHPLHEMVTLNFPTDWAQGGPIIEREGIDLDNYAKNPLWSAWMRAPKRHSGEAKAYGPTPLIAAMRCYVAGILGDEIEVPEELLK